MGVLSLWDRMRRISGIYKNVEHIILDYGTDHLECPANLRDFLTNVDGTPLTRLGLDETCKVLFGDTLQIREMD